ncbi:MAG: UxaA family hydrolase [Terracidiphilus sp.]|nr:UxaA family hydrolase [Terracidiphilus sp.]MDR3797364.1 UxaA family hydrolase [Terracidiphilus sp.]
MSVESTASAFQVHASDNVATLLGEAAAGAPLEIVGPARASTLTACEKIELGHKVALTAIPEGAPVVKFGIVIGIATRAIAPGEWVHLHNCCSQLDERSGHFDLHTGEPGDNAYA